MTPERSGVMEAADSAAYLQFRLALFVKLMFFSFVGLRVGEVVLYRIYPQVTPHNYLTIVAIGAASLVMLGATWAALARYSLSRSALATVDIALLAILGAALGSTAMLAFNRPESAYTCLIYACFMVFVRTIVVPSSGWRTVVVTTTALIPLLIAAVYLALTTTQDVPGPAFFAGGVMYTSIAVALAATGSRVIYGLRKRVSSLAREERELGQYTLVRKVGEGPTGEVFVARHALLRRPTAVKLVHPTRVGSDLLLICERAVREMSRLRHYNTVAVYDYGLSPDGVFYFAMEYLDGINLEALIEREGPQPPDRVIGILIQLCASLHEAHQRGFAHGNIKPANVILCERGGLHDVAKLTDFGFARAGATADEDLRALATLASQLAGDSAPELLACIADARSAKQLATTLRALRSKAQLASEPHVATGS